MNYLEIARDVFDLESKAVMDLSNRLDNDFIPTIDTVLESEGRVIVCGMGKSGIFGRKIAATLASTGKPSFFTLPGEAYHGGLGMVTPEDIFLALSNSAETDEVIKLIAFLKDNGNDVGIVIDGDLRRAIETYEESIFNKSAKDIMNTDPEVVALGKRMEDASIFMDHLKSNNFIGR